MLEQHPSPRSPSASAATAANPSTYQHTTIHNLITSSSSPDAPPATVTTATPDTDASCATGVHAKTQAAFVNKLYKMLEDPTIQQMIAWSESGDLFSVPNPSAFSRFVLPQYFKHNNWQSFVRQLNMYGFHKVNDMIHSNLSSDGQHWEFRHPHFRRGKVADLQNIKRKSAKSHHHTPPRSLPWRGSEIADDTMYDSMNNRVLQIEHRLQDMARAYKLLQNETIHLRSIISQQQETMQDIADMLVSMRQDDANGVTSAMAERIQQRSSQLRDATSQTTGCSSPSSATSTLDAVWLTSALRAHHDTRSYQLARRLPPIESMQTPGTADDMDSPVLKPPTGYSHLDFAGYEEPTDHGALTRKRQLSFASSTTLNDPWRVSDLNASFQSQTRPSVAYMGFGKESQLLNPLSVSPQEDKEQGLKRQRIDANHALKE